MDYKDLLYAKGEEGRARHVGTISSIMHKKFSIGIRISFEGVAFKSLELYFN